MEQFTKLTTKLKELFELEKADLDFGIHRIIKARRKHIEDFLSEEDVAGKPNLKRIVRRELGAIDKSDLQAQLATVITQLRDEYGNRAFEGDHLMDMEALQSALGKEWKDLSTKLEADDTDLNAQLEAEIYSHLYEFFSRYYDEADFLSKRRIKAGDAPYAVPYSGEEVMLHWANKDQYYIKTSEDMKDYTFTVTDATGKHHRIKFQCERQDPILNNNKAKREFWLDEEKEIQITDSTLTIPLHYKIVEKARVAAANAQFLSDLMDTLPAEWKSLLSKVPEGGTKPHLEKHFTNYSKKNKSDFFIHKHLGKFLSGELDFYIKNEVMHLDEVDDKGADYLTRQIRKIKAIRNIAHELISFLAQLENFQKKLWLKKKYVTETNYGITIDHLLERPDAAEILSTISANMAQRAEWNTLYALEEILPEGEALTPDFLRANDKLMVDTKHFPQAFKYKLLCGIDDLDEVTNGVLINSENFQALNVLQERYKEKVKCIYIDPPYNTGEDGFIYKDNYQTSSWLSMMEPRILEAFQFMSDNGIFLTSIDDYEFNTLHLLMRQVFGNDAWEASFIRKRRSSSAMSQNLISQDHEYVTCYTKQAFSEAKGIPKEYGSYRNPDNDPKGDWMLDNLTVGMNAEQRPNQFYDLVSPFSCIKYPANPNRVWAYIPESMDTRIEDGKIAFPDDPKYLELGMKISSPMLKRYKAELKSSVNPVSTLIDTGKKKEDKGKVELVAGLNTEATKEIQHIFGHNQFSYAKPKSLVSVLTEQFAFNEDTILDFFAGSGTTGHAVINLNREDEGQRKYILVEMGQYFDSVTMPRVQKVAYSADWKNGKPENRDTGVSQIIKYFSLEQYEDSLNNLELEDRSADLLGFEDAVQEEYLFHYMLDFETRGHLLNLERFTDPWGSQLKIYNPNSGNAEPKTIDLVESFNYLIGLTVTEWKMRDGFLTIEGSNPEGQPVLVIWRKTADSGSDWQVTDNPALTTFIESTRRINLSDTEYEAIYVNGDHTLHDPMNKIFLTEHVFYEEMFKNTGNPED